MNKDAEVEIERLIGSHSYRQAGVFCVPELATAIRAAMVWAYRDAARICRESNSLNKFACAYAIQKQSGIAGERDNE